MKTMIWFLLVTATTLGAGVASAEESAQSDSSSSKQSQSGDSEGGIDFSLAFTIGEGVYFVNSDVYRGPVSLEVVPSVGWTWFKFDLGLSTTLESVEIGGTDLGEWNFQFRPGARLTPPMVPLYLRVAFPVRIQTDDVAGGMLFGLGADIPLLGVLSLVLEVDSTLDSALNWGDDGVPLELRAGVSFHF